MHPLGRRRVYPHPVHRIETHVEWRHSSVSQNPKGRDETPLNGPSGWEEFAAVTGSGSLCRRGIWEFWGEGGGDESCRYLACCVTLCFSGLDKDVDGRVVPSLYQPVRSVPSTLSSTSVGCDPVGDGWREERHAFDYSFMPYGGREPKDTSIPSAPPPPPPPPYPSEKCMAVGSLVQSINHSDRPSYPDFTN